MGRESPLVVLPTDSVSSPQSFSMLSGEGDPLSKVGVAARGLIDGQYQPASFRGWKLPLTDSKGLQRWWVPNHFAVVGQTSVCELWSTRFSKSEQNRRKKNSSYERSELGWQGKMEAISGRECRLLSHFLILSRKYICRLAGEVLTSSTTMRQLN